MEQINIGLLSIMKTLKTKPISNTTIINNADIFTNIKFCVSAGNNGCSIIVPHVCNNVNLFGAGFAAATAKHYPIVKENFHLLGNKASLGHTQFVSVYKDKTYGYQIIFANMIAQNGTISLSNPRPLNYFALGKCMYDIVSYIKQNFDSDHRVQIHAPKFGSGLAGGNWMFIQELIKDVWNNQVVFVYSK